MNDIKLLDCTLRDGGYCNNWCFGLKNAQMIIHGLVEAEIEIVECGYLTNRIAYDCDSTRFTSVAQISRIIPSDRHHEMYVAMINYGDYDIDDLPQYDGKSIDGIRLAFHKKDAKKAIELCYQIKEKGYQVFVQDMVSTSYSDDEFLSLISSVNSLKPYAFYIVDSFGIMKRNELLKLFNMVDENLNKGIWLGFHSHNNMQLAYSNAQLLSSISTDRNIIIDSSVFGMGRGAGNLNTELFIEYLNENRNKQYQLKPILVLIDEIINDFYQRNYWGYSLPNYISAAHNAHPNYARFLADKHTLTIEGMDAVFELMDEDKKYSYDKDYAERLYLEYMAAGKVIEEHKDELLDRLFGKKVVLVAPGKSSLDESEKIKSLVKDNIIISVNHVYELLRPDYVFLSNMRRYKELPTEFRSRCIVTSNIRTNDVYYHVDYRHLTNDEWSVNDNAGLMAIRFLMDYKVDKIYLVGFDGYSHEVDENYVNNEMSFVTRVEVLDEMNAGMTKILKEYSKIVNIEFLTSPKHISC